MNNKKIAICMIYSFSCTIIVIISGLLAGIGVFVLFIRALIFASISFVAVFLGQFFLQNYFMDNDFNDDKSDNERGSTVDIVVDDA